MKVAIIIIVSMFFISVSYGQSIKNDLKGPKAKNFKYWKGKVDFEKKVAPVDYRQGPVAKNYAPYKALDWEVASKPVDQNKYKRIMGPKAKNKKGINRGKVFYAVNE